MADDNTSTQQQVTPPHTQSQRLDPPEWYNNPPAWYSQTPHPPQQQQTHSGQSSSSVSGDGAALLQAIAALPERVARAVQEASAPRTPPDSQAAGQQGSGTGQQQNSAQQGAQGQQQGTQTQDRNTPGKKKSFAERWYGL